LRVNGQLNSTLRKRVVFAVQLAQNNLIGGTWVMIDEEPSAAQAVLTHQPGGRRYHFVTSANSLVAGLVVAPGGWR
jgi:hypothetical protein